MTLTDRTTTAPTEHWLRKEVVLALVVAGFGFLVDAYDSVLFAIVRVASFKSLDITGDAQLAAGVFLFNTQMTGMVLGGLLWGVLGDKKGRKAALFGSIFLYSLANLCNAFVHTLPEFAVCRFISGIGLAGEVGAAMTIAAEVMPARYRTYGTAFVSALGVIGALLASIVGGTIPWRASFETAAAGGFILLLARISMPESPVFSKLSHEPAIKRGSIKLLLARSERIKKLACAVFSTLPLFFLFGILVSFAPEIWRDNKEQLTITVASLAFYYAIGETCGEVMSSILSQLLRSRKRVMLIFLCGAAVVTVLMLSAPASWYGPLCLPLGFLVGYWGVAITSTAEQFGTNLRSTATTLVPNLMRATVLPLNFFFALLCTKLTGHTSAAILAGCCFIIAGIAILSMEETFGKDLEFVEM